MNRGTKNYANRFVVILCIATLVNLAFYRLPGSVLGIPIKKVDLLSDIRIPAPNNEEQLIQDEEDVIEHDSEKSLVSQNLPASTTSQNLPASTTSQNLPATTVEDSLVDTVNPQPSPKIIDNEKYNADLITTDIEDFTVGHTGLHRFFMALDNIENLGRPVRIAFVGDSFIEGDIMVADFRAKMQERFGGRGVGFVPITSPTAQFRPTIKQSADGWNTYSIIKDKNRKFVISGVQFEPTSNNASFRYQTVDMYPGLEEVSSLKFIYSKNEHADLLLKNDDDTLLCKLPPSDKVAQFEFTGHFTKGLLQFKNAKGLIALGVALEDNQGVVVDNFSLRGNSGLIMSALDSKNCQDLQQIRTYDLIVLQYGLNVASDSVLEYGWYRNKMISVIEHMQNCFPNADMLILGVSDRSHKQGGTYSTMPAVVSLLSAQRQTAKSAEVAFWSIFAAMGGRNSMVKYVDSNWASKDYTHLSFRGGREVANALYDALLTKKDLYDSDDNRFDE